MKIQSNFCVIQTILTYLITDPRYYSTFAKRTKQQKGRTINNTLNEIFSI